MSTENRWTIGAGIGLLATMVLTTLPNLEAMVHSVISLKVQLRMVLFDGIPVAVAIFAIVTVSKRPNIKSTWRSNALIVGLILTAWHTLGHPMGVLVRGPEPYVVAGGRLNANDGVSAVFETMETSQPCRGYTMLKPDRTFELPEAAETLTITFTKRPSTTSTRFDGSDATLIASTPAGFFCNDDAATDVWPTITISDPPAGQYHVWVGSYYRHEYITGQLDVEW